MFRKLHSNLISLIFGKFFGGPFFLGTKFPGDQISWGPNFLGTTFLGDQISWGPNFPGTKFLGDQMSWGPNFLGTKKVQGPNFWGPNFSGTKFLGAQKTQGPKWVRGPTQLQPVVRVKSLVWSNIIQTALPSEKVAWNKTVCWITSVD